MILHMSGCAALTASIAVALGTMSSVLHGQSVTVPAATLDRYVGQYSFTDEPDIVYSVFRKGDELTMEGRRTPVTVLTPESDTEFKAPQGFEITFVTDGGKVSGLTQKAGDEIDKAVRVGDHPEHNHFRPYSREEVMIPMRDGIQLHAVILRPADAQEALPFLMQRTPYGVDDSTSDEMNSRYTDLAQSGYIFVMEDIRGRYKSQGKFVMMRPLANHTNRKAVDESTDTYDTVAWLLEHVPGNNGRVGVMGISYPGFLAMEAGIDPHPAVKAISPQAPMTDVWMGDDFFHLGAFRQTYGYDYALGMESGKENAFGSLKEDAYDYFLHAGSFAADVKASGAGDLPTWKAFLGHPAYDDYWRKRAVQPHLTSVTVPTLEVGGWWDQEDMWGPQAEYAALETHNQPNDPAHRVYLALGPWNHGGWARSTRYLADVDFGSLTGDYFRSKVEAPFFAYYLKDQPGFDVKNTITFRTGEDKWEQYGEWPPKGAQQQDLYFAPQGSLTFGHPDATEVAAQYVSDPANPVPYRKRPIQATYAPGSKWYTWLAQDQRFLGDRKDMAVWETPVLDHDVTITGNVYADLMASTSGSDEDWVVKLIDVYPDQPDTSNLKAPQAMAGYQLMIVEQIFRGRYRASFEHPAAAPPGKPEEYRFGLRAADHTFLKGHRMMVEVQSTWFPLYDRNPQTFVPNIMTAKPEDYKPATIKIYAGSRLELPVMPGGQNEGAGGSQ